jgi:transcriptional regulator with XRE-family HTH domain
MYNTIFFTNVLRLLDELGLTKNELAKRAGISVSFLSDLTNGKANPSLKIMEALAAALDMPLPPLLEMTDLDRDTLHALTGGNPPGSLPDGLVRATGILTGYQAFIVKKWDEENRKVLANRQTENRTRTQSAGMIADAAHSTSSGTASA